MGQSTAAELRVPPQPAQWCQHGSQARQLQLLPSWHRGPTAERCPPAVTRSPGAGISRENHRTLSHPGRHSLHSELLGRKVSAHPALRQREERSWASAACQGSGSKTRHRQDWTRAGCLPPHVSNHQTTRSCQRCFNSSWWAANEPNQDKGMGEVRNALHFSW